MGISTQMNYTQFLVVVLEIQNSIRLGLSGFLLLLKNSLEVAEFLRFTM